MTENRLGRGFWVHSGDSEFGGATPRGPGLESGNPRGGGGSVCMWNKYIYIYICVYIYMYIYIYMDVSKNSGTPKWMVYNGKPY